MAGIISVTVLLKTGSPFFENLNGLEMLQKLSKEVREGIKVFPSHADDNILLKQISLSNFSDIAGADAIKNYALLMKTKRGLSPT